MAIQNKDNVLSLVRSGLKIVGTLAVSAGFASADQTGQIVQLVEVMVGTGMTLAGLFMSLWEHTPDELPVATLRTLDPASLPPDVAAKMAQTPEPKP